MKRKLLLTASVLAMLSGSAMAADLGRGGLKDGPAYDAGGQSVLDHTGFYATVGIGIANGDREGRHGIGTSKNYLHQTNEKGEVIGDCKNGDGFALVSKAACQEARGDKFEETDWKPEAANTLEPGAGFGPNAVGDSIYTDLLKIPFSDDFDATVFGAGVSYLIQMPDRRFGLELGVNATFYGDNETKLGFGPSAGKITSSIQDDRLSGVYDQNEDGLNDLVEHTGVTSFERDFDVDLVLKGHYFITDRLSAFAGGGLSWAQASAQTAHSTGYDKGGKAEGVFDNRFDDSDNSFGYVLTAGAQYWITDRFVVGADYSYKAHEFDFNAGKSTDSEYGYGSGPYHYGVSDDISVKDDEHLFMARAGLKLN